MKIAIIGATGNVGTRLVNEALNRHHAVTAIARDPSKLAARTGLSATTGDAAKPDQLIPLLKGHDAIISSLRFQSPSPTPQQLIDLVRRSGVKRYLVVGGAASLEIAPGQILLNAPEFPGRVQARSLRRQGVPGCTARSEGPGLDLPQSLGFLRPGRAHGQIPPRRQHATDRGRRQEPISYEDYAVAMLDEIEKPEAHPRPASRWDTRSAGRQPLPPQSGASGSPARAESPSRARCWRR